MSQKTNDITVWQNNAPVVCIDAEQDFTVWAIEATQFAPVEDIDESFSVVTVRRRAQIF